NIKVGDAILTYTPLGSADGAATAEDNSQKVAKPQAKVPAAQPAVPIPASRLTATPASPPTAVKAAPSVRYLARKLGADLEHIRGTGPGGRILMEDLANLVKSAEAMAQPAPAEPPTDYGKPGTRIKFQGVRRKIAEHLVQAKRTIPHYSYVDECDVSDL